MLVQHHMNKALPVHQPDLLNTSSLRGKLTLHLESLSQYTPLEEKHLAIASYGQMLDQLSHYSLHQQYHLGPCWKSWSYLTLERLHAGINSLLHFFSLAIKASFSSSEAKLTSKVYRVLFLLQAILSFVKSKKLQATVCVDAQWLARWRFVTWSKPRMLWVQESHREVFKRKFVTILW